MRLKIKINRTGESRCWVARTLRGFNKKQIKEINEFRAYARKVAAEAEGRPS
jgi:hypothetical protein